MRARVLARVLGLDYLPYAEVSGHFALRATLRPLHRAAQSGEYLFNTGSRYNFTNRFARLAASYFAARCVHESNY